MELPFLTIKQASTLIKQKELSPLELTKSILERIQEKDETLNTYITVLSEKALESAKKAEEEAAAKEAAEAAAAAPAVEEVAAEEPAVEAVAEEAAPEATDAE